MEPEVGNCISLMWRHKELAGSDRQEFLTS